MSILLEEYEAAHHGWAVADFDELAALRMSGPDRHDFLHRLLTGDLKLKAGQACHAYYLTIQGRPLVEFFVFEQEKDTLLLTPRTQADLAMAELEKMHFGEKLSLAVDSSCSLTLSAGPQRPAATGVVLRPTRPLISARHQLLVNQDLPAGPTRLSAETLRVLRWEAGRALAEELDETTMFLEIAWPEDYCETKGCFPGQEVVSRTLHRGHINKKLCPLRATELPSPGAVLRLEGQEAGHWLCGGEHPCGAYLGLGMVRREFWEVGTELEVEGAHILVVAPMEGDSR